MLEITGLLLLTGPLALVVILWGMFAINKRKPPKRRGDEED
jgi:hypothetical protein